LLIITDPLRSVFLQYAIQCCIPDIIEHTEALFKHPVAHYDIDTVTEQDVGQVITTNPVTEDCAVELTLSDIEPLVFESTKIIMLPELSELLLNIIFQKGLLLFFKILIDATVSIIIIIIIIIVVVVGWSS